MPRVNTAICDNESKCTKPPVTLTPRQEYPPSWVVLDMVNQVPSFVGPSRRIMFCSWKCAAEWAHGVHMHYPGERSWDRA